MQANQKKKFKEFDGHFKNTLKLTIAPQLSLEIIDGIKQNFKTAT